MEIEITARLSFALLRGGPYGQVPPPSTHHAHYFSTETLRYDPYFLDFGPYNLAMTTRFLEMLHTYLQDPMLSTKRLVFCVPAEDRKAVTNGCILAGQYMIARCGCSATRACSILEPCLRLCLPFHDASPYAHDFVLGVPDVLSAFEKGIALGWYDFRSFNVAEYCYFEQLAHGDLNWVIPHKVLAFSGPGGPHTSFTVERYAQLFSQRLGVNTVVRLNNVTYDREVLIRYGIRHVELYYDDGTTPPTEIVERFFDLMDQPTTVAALHCKAGLGRTGTLIALYLMRNHGFSAKEAIAWVRMCRPGSVIGPQQQYLVDMEHIVSRWRGSASAHAHAQRPTTPRLSSSGIGREYMTSPPPPSVAQPQPQHTRSYYPSSPVMREAPTAAPSTASPYATTPARRSYPSPGTYGGAQLSPPSRFSAGGVGSPYSASRDRTPGYYQPPPGY